MISTSHIRQRRKVHGTTQYIDIVVPSPLWPHPKYIVQPNLHGLAQAVAVCFLSTWLLVLIMLPPASAPASGCVKCPNQFCSNDQTPTRPRLPRVQVELGQQSSFDRGGRKSRQRASERISGVKLKLSSPPLSTLID
ncbi:hypothetical protein BDZ91DRAFT_245608 [Kalaharituber pfeilii]|nr:hypothetical protein BDZ91DRAFT_245608 [Kalaharituber pfeilii]